MKKLVILSLVLGTAVFFVQTCTKADYYYNTYGNGIYGNQQAGQTASGYTYSRQNYTEPASVYQQPQYESYTMPNPTTASNSKFYTNWSDSEAQTIINNIGNGLKTSNSLNFALNFMLVNEQEVNAATDIGNNIYVYRGILPYVEREDELAFIIGHEMGHAASKHVVKGVVTDNVAGVTNTVGKEVLRTKVTSVAASKLGNLGGGLGSLAGNAITSAGSKTVDVATVATTSTLQRGRENDADLLAIDYLVKRGYNPLAGISIMYKIGDVYPDLFVDHPSTDKRVVTMYEYISKKYPQYLSRGFDTSAYSEAVNKYVRR